jgi:hypothetical protein
VAEDDVSAIEPRARYQCNEELTSVGLRALTRVGHGEETRSGVLEGEVLIREVTSVDALATTTIPTCDITTLAHKVLDDTMEGIALVVEGLSALTKSLLTRAKRSKVLRCFGNLIFVQLFVLVVRVWIGSNFHLNNRERKEVDVSRVEKYVTTTTTTTTMTTTIMIPKDLANDPMPNESVRKAERRTIRDTNLKDNASLGLTANSNVKKHARVFNE